MFIVAYIWGNNMSMDNTTLNPIEGARVAAMWQNDYYCIAVFEGGKWFNYYGRFRIYQQPTSWTYCTAH